MVCLARADQSHIFMGAGVLSLRACVDLGSFTVDGECGITQCCLCDRGAASLEKHEGSLWRCRATGHGYGMGHAGLRAVKSCGWCGVEGGEGLWVLQG